MTHDSKTPDERREIAERHLDAASAKESDNDAEGAIAAYSLAINADPQWVKPRMARGALRQKLGRRKEAIDDFTRSIQLEPGNLRAHAKRGVCYLTEREYAGAENDFSVALAAAPTHAILRAKRAEARLNLDKPWEALEDTNALVDAHPDNAEGYYLRGLALERLGDADGAERDFRDAARRNHLDAIQILRRRYGGL